MRYLFYLTVWCVIIYILSIGKLCYSYNGREVCRYLQIPNPMELLPEWETSL